MNTDAEQPSTEEPEKKSPSLRQLIRRVASGQKLLATLIAVIGIPTVLLTGYSTALSLKPEVTVVLKWDAKPAERMYIAQNSGARPLYHVRTACAFFNSSGPGLSRGMTNPGKFDVLIVPPNGAATGPLRTCNAEPLVSDKPSFIAVSVCYRDAIPFHVGYGTFVFESKSGGVALPSAVPFATVAINSDERFSHFDHDVEE